MEEIAKNITLTVSHAVEILAALIIGVAVLQVLWSYANSFVKSNYAISKEAIRIQFGSSVAVALELMLGADVLATAVAPSWDELGKLAAIAVIRTALNYFLERELKHIKEVKMEVTVDKEENKRA
jgi:uncharacterized membrane protein